MRLKTYYYIQYQESKTTDPTNAWTEMYVEIVLEGDSLATHFAVTVYTFAYIEANFIAANRVLAETNVLLVPTLENAWMWEYLQANPKQIVKIGSLV